MKSSAETQGSSLDTAKWILAVGLVVLGLAGFYLYGDEPLLFRVGGLLAVVGAAGAVVLSTAQGRAIWQFAQASKQEVRRVIWPTRPETLQTTLIVVAMVILVAIFLWLMDVLLLWLVSMLTGRGG